VPLATTVYDAEDNDPQSPAHDTPTRSYTDGLGRNVAMSRSLTQGNEEGLVTVLFDPLGRLVGYLDPEGYRKDQHYDLLGRVTHVDDLNAGPMDFAYDAAGNLLEKADARGEVVAMGYDGANRPVAVYDAARKGKSLVQTTYDYVPDCKACSHGEGQALRVTYPLGADRGQGTDDKGFDLRGRPIHEKRTLQGPATVLEDLAPKGKPDGRIDVADAWLAAREKRDAAPQLFASARRMLVESDGKNVYLHGDHLGSLTLATTSDGAVRGERAFYPTGDDRAQHGFVDNYGFTGQRLDVGTGLTHFKFRELDSLSGRWASPDPLFAGIYSPDRTSPRPWM
jgi:RHS repeat-associated protein